jgi:hypothetical protein
LIAFVFIRADGETLLACLLRKAAALHVLKDYRHRGIRFKTNTSRFSVKARPGWTENCSRQPRKDRQFKDWACR